MNLRRFASLLLLSLVLCAPGAVRAQHYELQTTPFTRSLLAAPDQGTFQSLLGSPSSIANAVFTDAFGGTAQPTIEFKDSDDRVTGYLGSNGYDGRGLALISPSSGMMPNGAWGYYFWWGDSYGEEGWEGNIGWISSDGSIHCPAGLQDSGPVNCSTVYAYSSIGCNGGFATQNAGGALFTGTDADTGSTLFSVDNAGNASAAGNISAAGFTCTMGAGLGGDVTINGQTPLTVETLRDHVQVVRITDQKASGNNAGDPPNTTAYFTRTLNTIEGSGYSGWLSLSGNQFTLQPGSYLIEANVPGYSVGKFLCRLQNITGSATVARGITMYSSSSCATLSHVVARVDIFTSAKTYEIQQRCTATSGSGWGLGVSSGVDTEVYTEVVITKYY